jgi:hypothetical protein
MGRQGRKKPLSHGLPTKEGGNLDHGDSEVLRRERRPLFLRPVDKYCSIEEAKVK